jgi:hypothetical protein
MSNYPITGRVKRAPAKQTDGTGESRNNKVTNAKVYADGETKTIKTDADVTGGEKVAQVASKNKCGTQAQKDAGLVKQTCKESGYLKVKERRKKDPCYNFNSCPPGATPTVVGDKCECKGKEKKTCPDGSTPDADGKCTKTETTPGVQGDLKTGTQSRVLQPWEISRINRGLQSNTRKVNLASKRLDKLGAIRAADGTYSLPEGASPKQQRKFEKQNNRLIGFRSNVKNSQIAINSGRGAGELVRSGQRNTAQDELEGGQKGQEKFLIEKARREAAEKTALENKKNEAATNQGIVTGNSQPTGQAAGAIDAATNAATEQAPVAGQSAGAIEAGQYVDPNSVKPTTDPQATVLKKRTPYKMMSKHPSISKMTAAQGKLPIGIQKAILAKEAKSGSGFKMRGYGKR